MRNVTFTNELKRHQLHYLQPSTCRLQTGGKSINCVIVLNALARSLNDTKMTQHRGRFITHISLLSSANVQLTRKKKRTRFFIKPTSFFSGHGNGSNFGAVDTFTRPPIALQKESAFFSFLSLQRLWSMSNEFWLCFDTFILVLAQQRALFGDEKMQKNAVGNDLHYTSGSNVRHGCISTEI